MREYWEKKGWFLTIQSVVKKSRIKANRSKAYSPIPILKKAKRILFKFFVLFKITFSELFHRQKVHLQWLVVVELLKGENLWKIGDFIEIFEVLLTEKKIEIYAKLCFLRKIGLHCCEKLCISWLIVEILWDSCKYLVGFCKMKIFL